jgi:hypothetical protein
MSSFIKRFGALGLAAAAVAGVSVEPAHGQNFMPGVSPFYQIRPGLNISQYAYNLQRLGAAMQSFPPNAFANPFAGAPGYMNPYLGAYSMYTNPYGSSPYMTSMYSGGGYGSSPYSSSYMEGYTFGSGSTELKGFAAAALEEQKANLVREQVRAERIKNQRSRFDERRYEEERTPTVEERRLRGLNIQVMRSRNNPPVTEINSGAALNVLLQDIRSTAARRKNAEMRTYQVPLSEDALKRINVAKGAGSLAILKNEGRLSWPVALSGADFRSDREKINAQVRDAVNQATYNGQVDAATIMQLNHDATALKDQHRRTGADLPPSLYIEANVFLNNLNDAIRALQQPDVGNYFTGKYALKAKTVPELVSNMTSQGLQFAAATPGDEPAYAALQEALASYDRAVNPNVERDLSAKATSPVVEPVSTKNGGQDSKLRY